MVERSFRSKYIVNRSDTFEEPLELKDENGDLITDEWTWRFTVRDSLPDTNVTDDTNAIISESGTFTNGTDTLTVSSTDTNIDTGTYYFDYQLKKPDGNVHSTLYGYFIVESDITRES